MDIKQKTAAVATLANVVLTVVKFVIYAYTGSMAILSEAWHSLSDIATSLLVFLALRQKDSKQDKFSPGSLKSADEISISSGRWKRLWDKLSGICSEELASFLIGMVLLIVSIKLFSNILTVRNEPLENTLIAGVVFFFFGLLSYTVYCFETQIGREEKSVGLTSDSLHSKSDMIASFLTGGSLIAYHFGLDIDRPVGFFIALLIFLLAMEVILMLLANRTSLSERGTPAPIEFRTRKLLLSLFDPATLPAIQTWLETRLNIRFRELPGISFLLRNANCLLVFLAAVVYLSTTFVVIQPSEQGIVERFGALQIDRGKLDPGLHFKLPWPFETIHTVDTELVRTIDVGMTVEPGEKALIWAREHGDVQPFLSGDNNFLYPYLTIMFRVRDPVCFLNRHANPVDLLQRLCLRAMTESIAGKALYSVFTEGRKEIVGLLADELQSNLDELETGLLILNVCLKDVHPPIVVTSDYEAVVSAKQVKQTMILDAFSDRNSKIPDMRGEAETLLRGADVYRINRECAARGEGARFGMTEESYLKTHNITRQRLYFQAMQNSLQNAQIILVDKKVKTPSLFVNSGRISPFEYSGAEAPGAIQDPLPDSFSTFNGINPDAGMLNEPGPEQLPESEEPLPMYEDEMPPDVNSSDNPMSDEILEDLIDRQGDD